jgi:hypothetical protein
MMTAMSERSYKTSRGSGLFNWLTGTGFLMFDATLFFGTLIVMVPWNLYSNPGDFWVADPLRKWAFLLAFHAILVGAWMLVRGLVSEENTNSTSAIDSGWPRSTLTATSVANVSAASRSPQPATASSLIAEEWALKWLADTDSGNYGALAEPLPWIESDASPVGSDSGSSWDDARQHVPLETFHSDTTAFHGDAVNSSMPGSTDHLKSAAQIGDATKEDDSGRIVEEDLEWQWIEAAASAWIAKRDRDLTS